MDAPPLAAIIVMGVSGAGKTTIGLELVRRLGAPWRFIDADDLHPQHNIEKMRAGRPLSDADRGPWLDAVRAALAQARADASPVVIACSALRRAHRQRIGADAPDVRVVWLHGRPELLRQRLLARQGHFMSAAMLPGQFAVLEPPGPGERVVPIDVSGTPEEVADAALSCLRD